MVRHMFPGGNTPNGFFSYFNYILPFEDAKKTICIKGGSGTGKSTFMKKIGKLFEQKDFDVEYMHCSNDFKSIDGICVPDLKISIIDATAPHVTDPFAPVAIDEILNVAVFLNETEIEKYSGELRSLLSDKKIYFEKAYRYLNGAYSIYQNNTSIYNRTLDYGKINVLIFDMIKEVFKGKEISNKLGKNRKLFVSAITPDGLKNFSDETLRAKKMYLLYGNNGCGIDIMLSRLQLEANNRGLFTESFYCPLNPGKPEHLIIPDLDVCFTTCNNYHNLNIENSDKINFEDFCNVKYIEERKDEIEYNTKVFEELMNKFMSTVKDSKKLHDRVEEIYISNMNFKKLEEVYESTAEKLLKLIP